MQITNLQALTSATFYSFNATPPSTITFRHLTAASRRWLGFSEWWPIHDNFLTHESSNHVSMFILRKVMAAVNIYSRAKFYSRYVPWWHASHLSSCRLCIPITHVTWLKAVLSLYLTCQATIDPFFPDSCCLIALCNADFNATFLVAFLILSPLRAWKTRWVHKTSWRINKLHVSNDPLIWLCFCTPCWEGI